MKSIIGTVHHVRKEIVMTTWLSYMVLLVLLNVMLVVPTYAYTILPIIHTVVPRGSTTVSVFKQTQLFLHPKQAAELEACAFEHYSGCMTTSSSKVLSSRRRSVHASSLSSNHNDNVSSSMSSSLSSLTGSSHTLMRTSGSTTTIPSSTSNKSISSSRRSSPISWCRRVITKNRRG